MKNCTLLRHERIQQGPPTQQRYEELVDEMATIRAAKVLGYGEERYRDNDLRHSMLLLYCDMGRKFIRLKEAALSGQINPADESLRDTLLDMANFSLMGIQILDYHAEQDPILESTNISEGRKLLELACTLAEQATRLYTAEVTSLEQ